MIEASSSQVPCTLPQSLETSNENKYHSVSTNDQKESLRCLQSITNAALPTISSNVAFGWEWDPHNFQASESSSTVKAVWSLRWYYMSRWPNFLCPQFENL